MLSVFWSLTCFVGIHVRKAGQLTDMSIGYLNNYQKGWPETLTHVQSG